LPTSSSTTSTNGTPTLFARLILLGILIPALLGIFTYVGFFTNYTTAVFNQVGFEQQYLESSIYRYRVLGSHLLLWTYQHIKEWPLADFAPYALKVLDKNGDPNFYYAYFLMNTFFLCLTCLALVLAFSRHAAKKDFAHIDLPVFCLALLISFSQFVITPYDTLSYCFLALAILPIMKNKPGILDDIFLGIIIVLATLTRETVALILSFYLAVHHRTILTKFIPMNALQWRLLLMTLLFLATYWLLRWQLGMENATFHRFRLLRNFSDDPLPIVGGMFLPCVMSLFFTDTTNRRPLMIFLLASVPYTLMMFAVAYPWEIRLWVPVILLMVFLKLAPPNPPQENPAT
jgi:hypothetical protein